MTTISQAARIARLALCAAKVSRRSSTINNAAAASLAAFIRPSIHPPASVSSSYASFFCVQDGLRRGGGYAIGLDLHLPIQLHERTIQQHFVDDGRRQDGISLIGVS